MMASEKLKTFIQNLVLIAFFFIVGFLNIFIFQYLFKNIVNSILTSIFLSLFVIFLINKKAKLIFDFKMLLICVLSFYIFSTSTLLNIDRSRSFYILSWVDNGFVTFTDDEFKMGGVKSLEKSNSNAIQNRIIEQINRGIIVNTNSNLELSRIGKVIVQVSNLTAKVFSLDGWQKNRY